MSFVLFVIFQKSFKIAFFVPNLVKNVSSKKIMPFVFFDIFCSFLLFLPDLVKKMWGNMSSNREQKGSCCREIRKMSFVFFVVGHPQFYNIAQL